MIGETGDKMLAVFDIGGTRMRGAASAQAGQIAVLGEVPTPSDDFAGFVEGLRGLIGAEARGVAISIAGCVDPENGRITVANIPCLQNRPVAEDLAAALGVPVWIYNDADCFAMAEAGSGAGVGHRTVFGIILGSGVGGGLVIDGRLVTGAGGLAGEWGHGPVANPLPLGVSLPRMKCGCGQIGCLDPIGGARGLARIHTQLHGEVRSPEQIVAAWQAAEVRATQTVAIWTEVLAGPLAMVLNVVGASVVPVGGGLSNAPALIAALDQAVRGYVLRAAKTPLVVPALLTVEPGLIGASHAGWQALRSLTSTHAD